MSFSDPEILSRIIEPCLTKAADSIPFLSLPEDRNSLVLYGASGALLDSLNLVTFVFQLEDEVAAVTGKKIKITTQDVLDVQQNPFASLSNLAKFLRRKMENES